VTFTKPKEGCQQRWNVESSPVHRAMWKHGGVEAFDTSPVDLPGPVRAAMDRSTKVVLRHKQAGTRYRADRTIAPALVTDLAEAGYWGMRAGPAYGGAGASFQALAQFITEMAVADPWVVLKGTTAYFHLYASTKRLMERIW